MFLSEEKLNMLSVLYGKQLKVFCETEYIGKGIAQ